MKSFLISDNKDIIIGLRLAGIEGVLVESEEDMKKKFLEATKDRNIGIIIVTETVFEIIKEEVLDLKKSGSSQLVVTIPGKAGFKDKDFIMKYIKESIGVKI